MVRTLPLNNLAIGTHLKVPKLEKVNLIVGKNKQAQTKVLSTIFHDTQVEPSNLVKCIMECTSDNHINRIQRYVVRSKDGILLAETIDNGIHHSEMDEMWQTMFETAQRHSVQVFATTHNKDCVESFSRTASVYEEIGGMLFRLGTSVRESTKGKVIATCFNAEDLSDAIASGIEVR